MFRLTLEGKSQYKVAKHFNTMGYATGMVYYKTGRIYRQDGEPQWNKGTISKMLTNRAYTGTLVQGVPDVLGELQKKTGLTRQTICVFCKNQNDWLRFIIIHNVLLIWLQKN